ncbi:glycoside hydrolase superfamily [Dactylonectria estremocensis]|uniref:beta-glucosidase n=1 Tax=Dactylonectria estremocensis TaxID=1079267 RepID=A0A9P9DQE4_9HYPO|nr:glycoside hydrolase superfamily [Dactylonectria estremocensis]
MAENRIQNLLSQLTLDEKLSLLAGGSQWRTAAVKRLGIPASKFSDGPSGARGEIFGEGVPAAFLPSGVSLGATWDVDLMEQIGQLLAEECKSKSASVSLAPTMCIHRHPLGGRNFESFSEDPYLTGKMAAAHVRGLQSRGVGATPKHFVANDQETKRFKTNAHIDPRALREVYLLPFQIMIREADPWCMMTAYNKVNGHHCDASKELLIDIARNEWNWGGVFMSDWGGTTSTVDSINNGLDLEMPGPPLRRSMNNLKGPLEDGQVDLNRVDESVTRILHLLEKAGRFENAPDDPEYCRDDADTKDLLLLAASSGIVMLKNDLNVLPLKPHAVKRLAIVGPNAKRVVAGGGGSSYIKAPYWTSVFESTKREFKAAGTEVVFHTGAKVSRYLPTPLTSMTRSPMDGTNGAVIDDDLYYMSFGTVPSEIEGDTNFSFRVRTILTPSTSGHHRISLASIGPAELFIDGKSAISLLGKFEDKGSLFFTYGSDETTSTFDFISGRDYDIRIDYKSHDRQLQPELKTQLEPMEDKFQGTRFGYEERDLSDLPTEAAKIAQSCDAAVVVVGRDKEWETEGQDIPLFELPGDQVRLIEEVAAVCKQTIVVVQAGTPVKLDPWIDSVQGVLYTWYQGQELGNATAEVLVGLFNPCGRLPMTFPRRIEDCPAYASFPGDGVDTYYSEGIFVGYKWWDLVGTAPHFPIGFGLSYNTFSISPVSISSQELKANIPLRMEVLVINISSTINLPGRQTVIAWLSQRSPHRIRRPQRQICGFAKSGPVSEGEQHMFKIQTDAYAFGVFDVRSGRWVVDAGTEFDVLIGSSAHDAKVAWQVTVPTEISWIH